VYCRQKIAVAEPVYRGREQEGDFMLLQSEGDCPETLVTFLGKVTEKLCDTLQEYQKLEQIIYFVGIMLR